MGKKKQPENHPVKPEGKIREVVWGFLVGKPSQCQIQLAWELSSSIFVHHFSRKKRKKTHGKNCMSKILSLYRNPKTQKRQNKVTRGKFSPWHLQLEQTVNRAYCQINIKLHSKGLFTSALFTQYIMKSFNKNLQGIPEDKKYSLKK